MGSWLHANCFLAPPRLLNPFYFQHMLEWSHRTEEKQPSELLIRCDIVMLWDCLLLEKNSSTSLSSSSSHTSGSKKRFMTLWVMYSFLSVTLLWWCARFRWTQTYFIKGLVMNKVLLYSCLEFCGKVNPCSRAGMSLSLLGFGDCFLGFLQRGEREPGNALSSRGIACHVVYIHCFFYFL